MCTAEYRHCEGDGQIKLARLDAKIRRAWVTSRELSLPIALPQLSHVAQGWARAAALPLPWPPRAGRKNSLAPVRSLTGGGNRVASRIQCPPRLLSISTCAPPAESIRPC